MLVVAVLLGVGVAFARPLLAAVAEPGADPGAFSGGVPAVADGYVAADAPISPFDDVPAIAGLHPALRDALRAAARDAEADGVRVVVTSGWRDQRYQDWLYAQALARGGPREASEYVAAGTSSRHLSGDAVDVGPTDADSWLQQHGARYGLCQIYANERWHFEIATTPGDECPAQYPDASSRP
jgi:D-alanyl-D-alanine dipeptidase